VAKCMLYVSLFCVFLLLAFPVFDWRLQQQFSTLSGLPYSSSSSSDSSSKFNQPKNLTTAAAAAAAAAANPNSSGFFSLYFVLYTVYMYTVKELCNRGSKFWQNKTMKWQKGTPTSSKQAKTSIARSFASSFPLAAAAAAASSFATIHTPLVRLPRMKKKEGR